MDGSVISRYNQIRTTEKVYISDNVFVENSIVKQTNTHPGGKTFNSQRRIESHYKKENSGKIVLLKQIVDGVEQSLEGIISSTIQDGDVTIISHERNKPVRTDFNGGYVILNYQKNICHQSANPLVSSERN
jgi:hypothetical protein